MTEATNFPPGGVPPISQARLDANWRAIEMDLDAPQPSRLERFLRRLGMPSTATRLAVATPSLRRAWYLAVAGAIFVALTAADADNPRQSVLLFLTVAPLVGVLGVAMAYGPNSDPAHELQLATPMRGLRVLAIRTIVVLAVSTVVITCFSLLNSVTRPYAAAWFLPGIAVAAASLAAMTFLSPRRAASAVAVLWCAVVIVSQVGGDPLAAFTPIGQVVAAAVAIVAIAIAVSRRAAFDRLAVAS